MPHSLASDLGHQFAKACLTWTKLVLTVLQFHTSAGSFSDNADIADPDQIQIALIRVYTVCTSTKYFVKQT